MLEVEIYSDKCKIPVKYRLYHGGKDILDLLKTREDSLYSRVSNHVYFSVDMGYVQQQYLQDYMENDLEFIYDPDFKEDLEQINSKNLFVMDARSLSSDSYVMTNLAGFWYEEIRILEGLLSQFKNSGIKDITTLKEIDPDFKKEPYYSRYFAKHPNMNSIQDIENRLSEAKKEWFIKYCKPFNIMHIQRYQKQSETIILVPEPIKVKNI